MVAYASDINSWVQSYGGPQLRTFDKTINVYTNVYTNGSGGYNNIMWAAGGLGYADGSVGSILGADAQLQAGPVTVEFIRDGLKATTSVLGHAYLGISKLIDAKGVIIRSTT